MIPAFPMDGGRVLRALLATRQDYGRATQIAAGIGQGIAVIFGFIGLLYNPFLLFIALFVWIGAAQEANTGQLKSAIGGIPVQQAMIDDFKVLDVNDSLEKAVELTLSNSQKDFPVVDSGRLVGILTQSDLLKALAEREKHATVATVIQTDFTEVDRGDMLASEFAKFSECNCHTLPVMQADRIVGLVTKDKLGEYMQIQAAMIS